MKIGLRVWILIIAVILSLLAIRPSFETGAIVKTVDQNSKIFQEGLRQGEIIEEINNQKILTSEDYFNITNSLFISGEEVRVDLKTKTNSYIILTNETLGITVSDVPHTRIKTGLDIQGGARALVQPQGELTDDQLQDLIDVSNNRFNSFGISDVKIRGVTDLSGNKFMLIEVAGATPSDLEDLVSQQGKFEAKIGNETVFVGGEEDITSVCRNDARCSGVTQCFPSEGGYACSFSFTIYLSEKAAKKHAEVTSKLDIDPENPQYLKENLTLVLDDTIVDELKISSGLKGQTANEISIQGSGQGLTQEEAFENTQADMHQLQTILITGSLPYKLEIVKLDTISPFLSDEFTYRILLAGLVSMGLVALIIFFRYRKLKLSAAILVTSFAEIIIILGVAALIGWNIDIASIAGILATIGTGVDQQIVIIDEARKGREASLRERLKRALFILIAAYLTSLVSLLPLYWAAAGLFKGFALTSIIGITAGVLISRPAFADMVKKMEKKSDAS